jgi:hypothetical protein
MTYNPNIPRGPDIPRDSQTGLEFNFQLIDSGFGANHIPYNAPLVVPVPDYRGYHTQINNDSPFTLDPNLPSPKASLYPKILNNIVDEFFQNGNLIGNLARLTGATIIEASQTTNLPGVGIITFTTFGFKTPWGIIINFGEISYIDSNFSVNPLLNFAVPYTALANIFCLQLVCLATPNKPIIIPSITAISATQFQAGGTGSLSRGYYIGIGR